MWLPMPVYERIPQFWFLLGRLFIASGLLLGFEFALSFGYIAAGLCCCAYGVGTFMLRIRNRQGQQVAQQTASAEESAPPESDQVEPVHGESAHAD